MDGFKNGKFVYKEILEYAQQLGKEISISYYLVWGGFPKRIELNSENEIRKYINDLDTTIVVNDIINRYKIRKSTYDLGIFYYANPWKAYRTGSQLFFDQKDPIYKNN